MMHKVQRVLTQKVLKAEIPFLHSARHLMLIDICIKIREYSLWSRGQTYIYGLFCEFVAPPRKKNLVTILS